MNVTILHGTGCKPEDFWYTWLKKRLESSGYIVRLPYMPNINKISIDEFLPQVINDFEFDENSILIGHSAGVPLILSLLENIAMPVSQAILVGGFSEPLDNDNDPILQPNYNWEKIKNNCKDFIIFNSPNDPWGCDDRQGRILFDRLGGTLIIRNDGHFGSSKDPGYKEFPILEKVIMDSAS